MGLSAISLTPNLRIGGLDKSVLSRAEPVLHVLREAANVPERKPGAPARPREDLGACSKIAEIVAPITGGQRGPAGFDDRSACRERRHHRAPRRWPSGSCSAAKISTDGRL